MKKKRKRREREDKQKKDENKTEEKNRTEETTTAQNENTQRPSPSRRLSNPPSLNYIFTPRALTSPFSPMLSSTRQSGQYHLVVRAGTAASPTHSRWNHSCLQFWSVSDTGRASKGRRQENETDRKKKKTRGQREDTYIDIVALDHRPEADAVAHAVPRLVGVDDVAVVVHLDLDLRLR